MASPTPNLSSLMKQTTIDDHDQVLKSCNDALKQSKGDIIAQHAKVVALIKTDRFGDALRVLDGSGEELKSRARFERAYALYKTGQLEDARALIKDLGDGRATRHLEAQTSYRHEDFAVAAELYRNLTSSQTAGDNEEQDLRINSGATDAQLEWNRQSDLVQKKKRSNQDLEAFETAYNAACASIARGELPQSQFLLQRAKDLCQNSDLSDAERISESLPISVQLLYVLTRLGKYQEAEKLVGEIDLEASADDSTKQIGHINGMSSTPKLSNPYLSQRLIQDASKLSAKDRLFQFQAQKMAENSLALDLSVGKASGVAKATQKGLPATASTSPYTNTMSVINAAGTAQCELGKLGLKKILPLMEKRPTDIGLAMTVVHLYILTNNHGSALTVLESLMKRLSSSQNPADSDARFAPGLIATLLALYKHENRKSQIKSELAKAASHWRHKSKPPVGLLQAAGVSLLESTSPEDHEEAREVFSTLRKLDESSRFATAGYVAANAVSAPEKVSKEAETLTPVARLIAGIDVSALESAGVPRPSSTDAENLKRKRALDEKPKPAKKRVRKSRLPKDYDPNKQPDPERWLPLRDRSTYKPKGKKGRKKAEQLTQGGVGENKAESTKGGGEGVLQAKGGGGGASKKSGKKKGKK